MEIKRDFLKMVKLKKNNGLIRNVQSNKKKLNEKTNRIRNKDNLV